MSKCSVRRLIVQGATLAVLIGTTIRPFEPALAIDVTTNALEPDPCVGDEILTYLPADPAVGEDLFIVASSAQHHRGVTLAGTTSSSYQGEYAGQLGWVWRWRVVPRFAGEHRFRLYVDATTPCGEITVNVAQSRRVSDNNNENGNGNSNGNGNDNDDNSNSNDNSDNDNTEKAKRPQVSTVTPSTSCAGGRVTIKGRNFGRDQANVGGQVFIANAQVVAYLSWTSTEIVVLVPNSALISPSQDVYVVNDADFDKDSIDIGPAPC